MMMLQPIVQKSWCKRAAFHTILQEGMGHPRGTCSLTFTTHGSSSSSTWDALLPVKESQAFLLKGSPWVTSYEWVIYIWPFNCWSFVITIFFLQGMGLNRSQMIMWWKVPQTWMRHIHPPVPVWEGGWQKTYVGGKAGCGNSMYHVWGFYNTFNYDNRFSVQSLIWHLHKKEVHILFKSV